MQDIFDKIAPKDTQENVSVKVSYPGIDSSAPAPTGNVSMVGRDIFDQIADRQDSAPPGYLKQFGQATVDQLTGMAKGIGSTAYGTGLMIRKYIPGLAWAGNKLSDYVYGGHVSENELEHGREKLGLTPTNLAQKIGFGAEQMAEYFLPGTAITKGTKIANAGARFAEAFPKISKGAPFVEYGARGVLEAAPAVAIAKAQGQEDIGQTASFALMAPSFGKLLDVGTKMPRAAMRAALPGKVARMIPEVPLSPRQMMWKALKPYVRNRDFDQALDRAMPEIYEQAKMRTAKGGAKVEDVDDFLALLKQTKARIWKPYEEFLAQHGKNTINGNEIADSIIGAIKPRQVLKSTVMDQETGMETVAGSVKKVFEWANKYRRKMTLQEAEDYLQNVNAEIASYYNLYPKMRNAALESKPTIAGAVAEAEALRKAIYGKVDDIGKIVEENGGSAIDAKHIKQVYGGLLNLEQEAYRRVNVAKRAAPESLNEQIANANAAVKFAVSAIKGHPLQGLVSALEGRTLREAAKVIRERNSSDYLIRKAFSDFGREVERNMKIHRIGPAASVTQERAKTSIAPKPEPTAPAPVQQKPLQSVPVDPTIQPTSGAANGQTIDSIATTQGRPVQQAVGASQGAGVGTATRIKIPGKPGAGYEARYQVRELEDIQSSHNGHNFQPNEKYTLKNDRDYTKIENQEKVVTASRETDFDPSYHLTDNPDATNGPPVIDALGNTIGGNGRTMILQRVFATNPKGAAAYRELLERKAAQFGIDPVQIRGMRNPVLVREISDDAFSAAGGKQTAITDLNKVGTASLRPVEKAIADSRRVSQGTLEHLSSTLDAAGADASLADILRGKDGATIFQRLVDDGVIAPQERAGYMVSGELTQEGKARISKLLLGRFFADPAQMERVPTQILNKIERTAATLANVEGKQGWNLSPVVQQALDLLERAGAKGRTDLRLFVKQQGLFGSQEYAPEVIAMAESLMHKGLNDFSKAVRMYAEDAQFSSKGAGLFGEPVTPAVAFENAFGSVKPK